MLKIGAVTMANPMVLAPMAGITDPPFRKLITSYHPGLVCGEMISAMALHYKSAKTKEMMVIDPEEKPISMQIFGSDPEIMAEAARAVAASGADILDINMGCPVPKVVKNGEGSALMCDLPLAAAIIKTVVAAVSIPVTVKMRLGWDEDRIVAPELAKIAMDNGAAAVIVHARTREQFYHGHADWIQIAAVKKAVSIPVIGNGSVASPQAARAMMEQTGCDGVMIGQGVLGSPWVMGQAVAYLETGELLPPPGYAEQFQIMMKHFDAQLQFSGVDRGIKEMRKHFAWYLKGMPGSAKIRGQLNTLTTETAVRTALRSYAAEIGFL